jgi:hypothetical protein
MFGSGGVADIFVVIGSAENVWTGGSGSGPDMRAVVWIDFLTHDH